MPDENETDKIRLAAEQKWAAYNSKMAALFMERDQHPVDSPEREAVAQRILELWASEG